jgi:hypothetical protein
MGARHETEDFTMPERGWKRWGVAATIGALTLSLYASPPASAFIESKYACDPTGASFAPIARKELAKRCLDDRYGTIALVGYDIDPTELNQIAEHTEKVLHSATNGLIAPHIIPVVASEAATAEFMQTVMHHDGIDCVDLDSVEQLAPRATDQLMDLSKFDHVVVDTNFPVCKDPNDEDMRYRTTYGMSWDDRSWRYGMVFDAAKLSRIKLDPFTQADFAGHEIGHMLGLGHAGSFASAADYPGHIMSLNHFKTYANMSNSPDIDVDKLLSAGNYDEYASPSNIMGSTFYDNNGAGLYLNGMQRQRLEWPERITGETTDLAVEINGCDWVTLQHPTNPNHNFGVFNLRTLVRLTDKTGRPNPDPSLAFGKLVIDPVFDHQGNMSDMVEVYLANDPDYSLTTMSLGFLDLTHQSTRTLRLGGQTIKITADKDGNYIVSHVTT